MPLRGERVATGACVGGWGRELGGCVSDRAVRHSMAR